MKCLTMLLTLWLAALCLCPARAAAQGAAGDAQAQRKVKDDALVVSSYDRAADWTTHALKAYLLVYPNMPVRSRYDTRLMMSAVCAHAGQGAGRPERVNLLFVYRARDWLYSARADARNVRAVVDGTPQILGALAVVRRDVLSGRIEERAVLTLTPEMFLLLARADRLKMLVGPLEYELSDSALAALRELAQHTEPKK